MIDDELGSAVRRDGYAFARAARMRERLGALPDWDAFAASWSDLRPDEYMADGGRYRRRRHAVLSAAPGATAAVLEPRQPHYQSPEYNPLNGGVERWFAPIAPATLETASLRAALGFGLSLSGRLRPGAAWKIELHQFRIEASPGVPGKPTPEGAHRDGVDCVLVLLVRRENVLSGTTTVCDLAARELGAFTLTEPLDCAFVDDARVKHGVTPIVPLDPAKPAYRDVLVATFLKK